MCLPRDPGRADPKGEFLHFWHFFVIFSSFPKLSHTPGIQTPHLDAQRDHIIYQIITFSSFEVK